MKDIIRSVLAALLKKGVDYADIRHERITGESIRVRDDSIEGFSSDFSEGVGIRVLYEGAWGFASTNDTTEASLAKTAGVALSIARRFSALNTVKVRLAGVEAHIDSYTTPFTVDPFSVSPEAKIDLLLEVASTALRQKDIAVCEAFMEFTRAQKSFYSTAGTEITQTIITSGGGYNVTAEDGHEVHRRSYPDGHHGLFSTGGFEIFDDMRLLASVERISDEARSLLRAKECPAKKTDIIIDGPQMALQIHESCGHPAELDRVLGSELGFAGGSFLTLDKQGAYRYGSPKVNLYADPTIIGGAGSYCYDDEGVRAERVDLVRDGIFVGYLNSRESAGALLMRPNGSMRAEGWDSAPLVRMSNISIEPGTPALAELIADTKDGLLLSTNRSWSIDDQRLNFQFGTEIAWEIKNGRIGQAYKNPVYYGMTPEFWGACDAVCSKADWRMWGLNSCGKGEPLQTASVGHGASPARFRGISVGVLKEG